MRDGCKHLRELFAHLPEGVLRKDRLHHFTMHVGEAELAALEAEGEPLVVDAEQVQDGGLKVMHMDGMRHLSRFSMADTGAISRIH